MFRVVRFFLAAGVVASRAVPALAETFTVDPEAWRPVYYTDLRFPTGEGLSYASIWQDKLDENNMPKSVRRRVAKYQLRRRKSQCEGMAFHNQFPDQARCAHRLEHTRGMHRRNRFPVARHENPRLSHACRHVRRRPLFSHRRRRMLSRKNRGSWRGGFDRDRCLCLLRHQPTRFQNSLYRRACRNSAVRADDSVASRQVSAPRSFQRPNQITHNAGVVMTLFNILSFATRPIYAERCASPWLVASITNSASASGPFDFLSALRAFDAAPDVALFLRIGLRRKGDRHECCNRPRNFSSYEWRNGASARDAPRYGVHRFLIRRGLPPTHSFSSGAIACRRSLPHAKRFRATSQTCICPWSSRFSPRAFKPLAAHTLFRRSTLNAPRRVSRRTLLFVPRASRRSTQDTLALSANCPSCRFPRGAGQPDSTPVPTLNRSL